MSFLSTAAETTKTPAASDPLTVEFYLDREAEVLYVDLPADYTPEFYEEVMERAFREHAVVPIGWDEVLPEDIGNGLERHWLEEAHDETEDE